MVGRHRI